MVVVGGGGSGLMAALEAARAGARVLLVEKQATLGGTTALSVGTISASGTRLQHAAGIDDGPDAHFEDMAKFHGKALAGRDHLPLRRVLVEAAPQAVARLEELGVVFVGPFPEGEHRCPRLHAIVPHARGYIRPLVQACRRNGVVLKTGTAARRVLVEDGRVAGVELEGTDGNASVAAKSVVLAAGDFSSADRAFRERFLPSGLWPVPGINPASTGDGQRLGLEVGGRLLNGDLALGPEIRFPAPPRERLVARLPPWRWLARSIALAMGAVPAALLRPLLLSYVTTYLAPSHTLFQAGAILVNREGRRFGSERSRPQDRIAAQSGQDSFIILDASLAARFESWPNFISTAPGVGYAYLADYRRSRPDICFEAPDLPGLAVRIGVPASALAESVAELASDPERAGLAPFGPGPYVALGPAKPWIVFTEGGLQVDETMRVLAEDRPINGLFAAGSNGQSGLLLEGHGHHLGWAFASGLLAGKSAASFARGGSPVAGTQP